MSESKLILDEEFVDVGKKDGLNIWRIQDFKLVKQNPKEYGSFFEGDSYLILHTTKLQDGSFSWNIHFWLGIKSTIDEMGTAAIKAVELDDLLGGKPVQYREVQFHESKLFYSYFDKKGGIRYLLGGVKSGFFNISSIEHEKKLYLVKGKNNVRIIQVPLSSKSLNKSDAFILDDGADIYQWNAPKTNRVERMKANEYARKIRDDEHSGKSTIHIIDENEDNRKFWQILNCKIGDVKDESDVSDIEFEVDFKSSKISLFKVSDSNSEAVKIQHIADGPLSKSLLDSNDCFIVDAGKNGIYSWIGRKCTKNEKLAAVKGAKEIMSKNNYPNYYPMSQVIDGAENTTFKSIFNDW